MSTSALIPANNFSLRGRSITFNFSTTSFTGEPRLTIVLEGQTHHFQGGEDGLLTIVESVAGRLVFATLTTLPDLGSTSIMLVVPEVNVNANNLEAPIEAYAVVTNTRMNIGGSNLIEGQIQFYRSIELEGTASFLTF